MMIFYFHIMKKHTNIEVALKPNYKSCRVLYFLKYAFSLITLKIFNLHNKRPKKFALHIFCVKFCLHPYIPC